MALIDIFNELARCGSAPADAWPAEESLESFGLERRGSRVVPAGSYDPLVAEEIRRALAPGAAGWLRELTVHPAVGSTNVELMARAERAAIAGCVHVAELQLQGRGRRGRSWASPFGANLALSLGMGLARPAADLGGVSLVVGLAVVNALEELGVAGLAVKWPNDVLLGGAKLGGILIELTRQRGTELVLVVGIGLNVALPAAVRATLPPEVTDLASSGRVPGRNALAAGVVSDVVAFVAEFDRLGFPAFREAFELRHAYHGRECCVLQGEDVITGRVAGVSDQGGLLLRTPAGVREFHGGEVSLRPAP